MVYPTLKKIKKNNVNIYIATMQQTPKKIVCVCGNDGTGKSTIVRKLNQNYTAYLALQRSTKLENQTLMNIVSQIKQIDKLTYRYTFEKQRSEHQLSRFHTNQQGETIKIYWIMISASASTSLERVKHREDLSIFQSKKCVQFYAQTYLDMAHYYGIPIIRNDNGDKMQQVILKIVNLIQNDEANQSIHHLGLKYMNYQTISSNNVQSIIQNSLNLEQAESIYQAIKNKMKNEDSSLYSLFYPEVQTFQQEEKFKMKIAARQLLRQGVFNESYNKITYAINNQSLELSIPQKPYFFYLANEGQSKYIYKVLTTISSIQQLFENKVVIVLKSTIYSHRKQHTGQIKNLGKVRASGSMLFLEMLRRNSVKHAYICLNQLGIIVSQEVQPNMLEIVFKCKCIGTDKYSYFHIDESTTQKNNKITLPKTKASNIREPVQKFNSIVQPQTKNYSNSIYIRYDWRNPNFIIQSNPSLSISSSTFYYPIEKYMQKEVFFEKILKKKCKPIGDKCITPALVSGYIDQKLVNSITLKLYCTLSYYLAQVGLELIDGCIMIDQKGTIWSEINPDCMRVKSIKETTEYDKDIWRKGGSSAKQEIIQKWTLFNKILSDYFLKTRFHQTQMWEIGRYPYQITAKKLMYQCQNSPYLLILHEFLRGQRKKQFIATIDLSKGCPKLVKSSQISESHTEQNVQKCFKYLSVVNKVVMVDLDGAIFQKQGFPSLNQQKLYQLKKRQRSNLYAVGGGIRTDEVVNYYKKLGIKRLIYSTNLQLVSKEDPSIEPIVQLSINENNQVLTHGRTVNTHINVFDKMIELSKLNVKIISVTIVQSEGRLKGINRKQLSQLLVRVPGKIEKIIIAGGITTIDDLQFLWGFEKCIPQLGAAIWKKTIDLGELLTKIIQFKQVHTHGTKSTLLCPAIIQQNGEVLGQIFLDKQAIQKTVTQRRLWRYSRKQNKLMLKGATSNNILNVDWIRIDCDNDCLLIGVQQESELFSMQQNNIKNFCHEQRNSCFESCEDISLHNIQKHIFSKIKAGGYSSKIQQYPGRAYLKVIQQSWEMYYAQNKKQKIHECTDMLAHTIMYLNSQRININQILQELRTRTYKSSSNSIMRMPENEQVVQIGIVSGKHHNYCDLFILQMLGIKIIRPKSRDFKLQFEIVDQSKFEKYFQNKRINLLGIKSKDMSTVMVKRKINFAINYTIMMENLPEVSSCIAKMPFEEIKLGLIKKKDQIINPLQWTQSKKGIIASQYPLSVIKYLLSLGVKQECFTIMRVSGCSQSYIRVHGFDYCDAIVVTGKTIEENNLEIEAVLESSIYIGLYKSF